MSSWAIRKVSGRQMLGTMVQPRYLLSGGSGMQRRGQGGSLSAAGSGAKEEVLWAGSRKADLRGSCASPLSESRPSRSVSASVLPSSAARLPGAGPSAGSDRLGGLSKGYGPEKTEKDSVSSMNFDPMIPWAAWDLMSS